MSTREIQDLEEELRALNVQTQSDNSSKTYNEQVENIESTHRKEKKKNARKTSMEATRKRKEEGKSRKRYHDLKHKRKKSAE